MLLPQAGGCDGPVAIFQTDLQPEDLYLRTNGAESDSEEERYYFGANELTWVKDHPWYCRDSSYLAYVKYRPVTIRASGCISNFFCLSGEFC